jgi:hypothetical protein
MRWSPRYPKDPDTLFLSYKLQSKTRGNGYTSVMTDGDFILVECFFRVPK